jgi:hypothetical protein
MMPEIPIAGAYLRRGFLLWLDFDVRARMNAILSAERKRERTFPARLLGASVYGERSGGWSARL